MPEPGLGRPACYNRVRPHQNQHEKMTHANCLVVSAVSTGGGVGRPCNRLAAHGGPKGGLCFRHRRRLQTATLGPSPSLLCLVPCGVMQAPSPASVLRVSKNDILCVIFQP